MLVALVLFGTEKLPVDVVGIILVYTPGCCKFMDFVKIGTILTIIVFIVAIVLVPVFWKL